MIDSDICKKILDKKWLQSQLEQGTSVQELLQFSTQTMDQFYQIACNLYESKEYKDAADAFLFLVTVDPTHYDYWIGLGAATQRLQEYEMAIDAYEMAAICQLENPIPYFHLAKCLFAIHDRDSALKAIDLALEYSQEQDFGDLHKQALAAKQLLLREQ